MAAASAARSLIEVRLLDRAALVRLLDCIPERGAGDEGTELQLVAAGQEDGTDLAQRFHKIRILCLRSTLRAQRNDFAGSERCEDAVVDLDHLNTQRGCRGNDRDPRVGAPAAAKASSTVRRRSLASAPLIANKVPSGGVGACMSAGYGARRRAMPRTVSASTGGPSQKWPRQAPYPSLRDPGRHRSRARC
jgi:hypothetical protein